MRACRQRIRVRGRCDVMDVVVCSRLAQTFSTCVEFFFCCCFFYQRETGSFLSFCRSCRLACMYLESQVWLATGLHASNEYLKIYIYKKGYLHILQEPSRRPLILTGRPDIRTPRPHLATHRDRLRGTSTWEGIGRPMWHVEGKERFDAVQDHGKLSRRYW